MVYGKDQNDLGVHASNTCDSVSCADDPDTSADVIVDADGPIQPTRHHTPEYDQRAYIRDIGPLGTPVMVREPLEMLDALGIFHWLSSNVRRNLTTRTSNLILTDGNQKDSHMEATSFRAPKVDAALHLKSIWDRLMVESSPEPLLQKRLQEQQNDASLHCDKPSSHLPSNPRSSTVPCALPQQHTFPLDPPQLMHVCSNRSQFPARDEREIEKEAIAMFIGEVTNMSLTYNRDYIDASSVVLERSRITTLSRWEDIPLDSTAEYMFRGIRGDGNCMLRSIVYALVGHQDDDTVRRVRRWLANYMEGETRPGDDVGRRVFDLIPLPRQAYVEMSQDGVHVGRDGLMVLAHLLQRPVRVYETEAYQRTVTDYLPGLGSGLVVDDPIVLHLQGRHYSVIARHQLNPLPLRMNPTLRAILTAPIVGDDNNNNFMPVTGNAKRANRKAPLAKPFTRNSKRKYSSATMATRPMNEPPPRRSNAQRKRRWSISQKKMQSAKGFTCQLSQGKVTSTKGDREDVENQDQHGTSREEKGACRGTSLLIMRQERLPIHPAPVKPDQFCPYNSNPLIRACRPHHLCQKELTLEPLPPLFAWFTGEAHAKRKREPSDDWNDVRGHNQPWSTSNDPIALGHHNPDSKHDSSDDEDWNNSNSSSSRRSSQDLSVESGSEPEEYLIESATLKNRITGKLENYELTAIKDAEYMPDDIEKEFIENPYSSMIKERLREANRANVESKVDLAQAIRLDLNEYIKSYAIITALASHVANIYVIKTLDGSFDEIQFEGQTVFLNPASDDSTRIKNRVERLRIALHQQSFWEACAWSLRRDNTDKSKDTALQQSIEYVTTVASEQLGDMPDARYIRLSLKSFSVQLMSASKRHVAGNVNERIGRLARIVVEILSDTVKRDSVIKANINHNEAIQRWKKLIVDAELKGEEGSSGRQYQPKVETLSVVKDLADSIMRLVAEDARDSLMKGEEKSWLSYLPLLKYMSDAFETYKATPTIPDKPAKSVTIHYCRRIINDTLGGDRFSDKLKQLAVKRLQSAINNNTDFLSTFATGRRAFTAECSYH
ncbi:hypothetical protein BC829DRAFT_422576 [Chytridium lagenaria]|nr:hypothetical protein BC829DRAFT_422576 [Chytridium lagenaria]